MASVNLKELNLRQLKDHLLAVQDAIVSKEKQAEDDFKAEIVELATKRGIDIDSVLGKKRAKKSSGSVAPKYKHPKDATLTWSGRGKAPKWMQAELSAGKKKEEFLIK